MTARLYGFPGVIVPERGPKAQPQPHVIDMLRDLLERAEQGDIQAAACTFVMSDQSVADAYKLGPNTTHQIVAGAGYLHARLLAAANQDADSDFIEPPPQGA